MNKFKKGDKVKRLSHITILNDNFHLPIILDYIEIDKIYTVCNTGSWTWGSMEYDCIACRELDYGGWMPSEWFELVESKSEWKVGDTFEVTVDKPDGSELRIGTVYTVGDVGEHFVGTNTTPFWRVAFQHMKRVSKPTEEKWVPQVGDWAIPLVKSEQAGHHCRTVGKAYKICSIISETRFRLLDDKGKNDGNGCIDLADTRKALPHEIPQEKVKVDMNTILKEAKKRYPVGCSFYSAKYNTLSTVSHGKVEVYLDGIMIDNCYCWKDNKWAEIVSLPKKVEDIPEYVEVLGGFDSTQTGKIFKTSDKFPSHLAEWNYGNWKETLRLHGEYFKSSTKEAYDAQFVKYDKEQSLKKEDLVKGEFYFFGKDSWEYDYIEYYSHDNTYATIKKRKNGSDWFFDASNYWSSFADAGAGFIRKATAEEKDIFIKIMEEKRINLGIKKTEKSLKDAVYQNLEVLTKDWIPNVTEFISPFGNKYTFTGIGSWTVEGSIHDASGLGILYRNGIYAQKHVDKPWCENVEDFFTKSVKTGSHYGIYSGFQKNPLKYIWSTEPLNITSKEDVIKAPKPILWADNIKTDKKSNQLIIIKK